MTAKPKPRRRGRPALHGERLEVRTVGLPASTWKKLDAQAKRRGVSTGSIVRELIVVEKV